MDQSPSLTNTDTHGLKTNHCRAVDSTGIKVEGEGEWNARKHGGPKRRVWRKIHIGIDEQTLEVRAVEITAATLGMHRCYLICLTRSRTTRRLEA